MTDSFRDQLQDALAPNYTIDRELAGGGMSRVFVAVEHALSRTVVVKVLKPELAAGVNRERFRREIIFVAQLQHPHIVPVLNAGEHSDLLWYTMPFVEGESLRGALAQARKFSPREVVRVLHDVLDALAYAHRRGVIHRDIKPGNILRHGSHSLVTDFGVAKALSASLPHSGTTSVGIAIGTPAYMAPEQLAADPSADHRMDLYAVGLLAYELLTGEQPFGGRSPQATMAAQLTRMPTPLEECCPGVPPQLSALVMRLLAKLPDDRPGSAAAALDELEALPISGVSTASTAPAAPGGASYTPAPAALSGGTSSSSAPSDATLLSTTAPSGRGHRGRTALMIGAGVALALVGVLVGRSLTGDTRRQTAMAADSTRVANAPVPVPLPSSLTRADSLRIADAVRKQMVTVRQTDARGAGPNHDLDSLRRTLVRVYTDSVVREVMAGQERARIVVHPDMAGIADTIAAAMKQLERLGVPTPPTPPRRDGVPPLDEARARARAAAAARITASPARSATRSEAPRRLTASGKPMRVAILPVRDGTARPALAPVARALEDSVKRALTAAGFTLATDGELVRLLGQSDLTGQRRTAEEAGIGALVTIVLTARDDEVVAQGIVLDVWRGFPFTEREAAGFDKPDESLGVVRDIARALERVSWRTRSDPRRMVLFDLENQTGVDSMSVLTRQISDTLRSALANRLGVEIVADSQARSTTGTSERRQVGARLGAGAIVAGGVYRARGDSVSLRLSARDLTEERSFPSFELRVARASLNVALATAVDRLVADLGKVNWGPKGLSP